MKAICLNGQGVTQVRLRIQDSILLKEYSVAYHPDGRAAPLGWTPDDTLPEVQAHADELFAAWVADERFVTPEFALTAAAMKHRDALRQQHKPQPGWMVVGLGRRDLELRKAYRELVIRMNDGKDLASVSPMIERLTASVWPPDGFYVFERGVMRPEGGAE